MMIVKATVFAFYLWRVFPETAVICVLHCMLSIACLLRLRCCITSLCSVVSGHHRLDQIQKNLLGDLTQPAVTAEKKALTKTKFVCVCMCMCVRMRVSVFHVWCFQCWFCSETGDCRFVRRLLCAWRERVSVWFRDGSGNCGCGFACVQGRW